MVRRNLSPQFSSRSCTAPHVVSLCDSRILRALFVFTVLALLCVAHVSLRFKTLDLKVQHRQLQERSRLLTREAQQLQYVTVQLAENRMVREAARTTLNLREADPQAKFVAHLPSSLVERYRVPVATRSDSAVAVLQDEKPLIQRVLASIADGSQAQAASPDL